MENLNKNQNDKNIILNKVFLTPADVKEYMGIGEHRSYDVVKEIRYKNAKFYQDKDAVFGKTNILPLHLMEYLGWTRQEFFDYIFAKKTVA